jgi:3-deoxy-manno-octulosonate cytidylyltransferase (CMP-KDO synthetase)
MKNIAIIIPTRLGAHRFPNKPLVKINNVPMIVHVLNRAKESKVGDVIVATPDDEILEVVEKNGGKAILTKGNYLSGSDRIFEVYKRELMNDADLIVNLQGDMPNIKPNSISKLVNLMKDNNCDIGTLASHIRDRRDIDNKNIVKVHTKESLNMSNFLVAKDFFREKKYSNDKNIYHHIGIYAFTSAALTKYVKFPRSKLEIERNLEQMRAMENNLVIKVGLCDSTPLGVDTEQDLIKVTQEMN